jgi:hypothetical protein
MGSLTVVIEVELAPIVLAQMQSLALLSQQERDYSDWPLHHTTTKSMNTAFSASGTSSFF